MIRKQSNKEGKSSETMRKRKRHQWRERTSQQPVRGEDIPGTYRQSTQVRTPAPSQAKVLELLWILELFSSHTHEPCPVIVLTLPEATWLPFPVSLSSLKVTRGNHWVF